MPLQNRVDPFGAIHAVPERGMFTGNRGIIHDPSTKTLLSRRWSAKAWIICACQYKGHWRPVMGPGKSGNGSWTELFFLDEVTALSAGHRPCFYCRRQVAVRFAMKFGEAVGLTMPKVRDIDAALHAGRLAAGAIAPALDPDAVAGLPDGGMIAIDGKPYAIRRGWLLPWSFAGYGEPVAREHALGRHAVALTPSATLAVLANGFQPAWHPSAGP